MQLKFYIPERHHYLGLKAHVHDIARLVGGLTKYSACGLWAGESEPVEVFEVFYDVIQTRRNLVSLALEGIATILQNAGELSFLYTVDHEPHLVDLASGRVPVVTL